MRRDAAPARDEPATDHMSHEVMRMRSALICQIIAVTVAAVMVAPSPLRAAAPPAAECRNQSSAERPNLTADDIANCVIESAGPTRLKLSAAYTYASPLGKQNIWMGLDVLAGGNRLKWFGYRPASITSSSGTLSVEIVYGQNSPPKGKLTTDQVELFLYVGGGQIFFRKLFTLKHGWEL